MAHLDLLNCEARCSAKMAIALQKSSLLQSKTEPTPCEIIFKTLVANIVKKNNLTEQQKAWQRDLLREAAIELIQEQSA